jgi:Ni/Fe-hydrogenase subunit HybB-like protein
LRIVAGWTVLGVVVNRLNVSVIAMNWDKTPHYVPSVMEMITTVTIITLGVLTFRWIVNRMPILHDDPRFAEAH